MNRKERKVPRKVPQRFKTYLCETLRFTLRNFAVKKNEPQRNISLRNFAENFAIFAVKSKRQISTA
ncbi:MAG: hypothetical protein BWK80_02830 [Desulfobacteraceae bacterium IS3]|nr:MAG: hypothetical protein BWK80_02830 [Desulfobacteraceae bacterium IS3]